MPAPSHPELTFALDVVDKLIKFAAVLIAGSWTWWNYRKSRTYQQKLELEVAGTVFTRNGDLYGDIVGAVRNIGAGKHVLQNEGTFCIVSIVSDDLSEHDIHLFRAFPTQTQIEPGESLNDTQYWRIPGPFDDILWVKLTLRVVSGGVEWITTCLVRVETSTNWGRASMTIKFRSVATDSMPERIKVTQELELRYKKQQEELAKKTQETSKAAQGR